jgi:hypothetical protein
MLALACFIVTRQTFVSQSRVTSPVVGRVFEVKHNNPYKPALACFIVTRHTFVSQSRVTSPVVGCVFLGN